MSMATSYYGILFAPQSSWALNKIHPEIPYEISVKYNMFVEHDIQWKYMRVHCLILDDVDWRLCLCSNFDENSCILLPSAIIFGIYASSGLCRYISSLSKSSSIQSSISTLYLLTFFSMSIYFQMLLALCFSREVARRPQINARQFCVRWLEAYLLTLNYLFKLTPYGAGTSR